MVQSSQQRMITMSENEYPKIQDLDNEAFIMIRQHLYHLLHELHMADFDVDVIKEWLFQLQPEAVELGLENYTHFLTPPPEEKIVELIEWFKEHGFEYVLKENLRSLEESTNE